MLFASALPLLTQDVLLLLRCTLLSVIRSLVLSGLQSNSLQRFFTSEDHFERGLICRALLACPDFKVASLSPVEFSALRTVLQPSLLKAYHQVWKDRNSLLNQKDWSFASRTRQVYGLSRRQFSDALLDDSVPDPIQPIGPLIALQPAIVTAIPHSNHDAVAAGLGFGVQPQAPDVSIVLADILLAQ